MDMDQYYDDKHFGRVTRHMTRSSTTDSWCSVPNYGESGQYLGGTRIGATGGSQYGANSESQYGAVESQYATESHKASRQHVITNKGLDNFGNTCYLNVIIQTLLHLKTFRTVFDDKNILELFCQKHSFMELDESIIMNLRALFFGLSDKTTKIKSIAPLTFRSALQYGNALFNNDDQQDVQEAFIMILEMLHNEISQKVTNPMPCINANLNDACNMHWYNNFSPIYNLFHGMYYVQRRCMNCAHKKINYEPNCFLGLDITTLNDADIEVDYQAYFTLKCKINSIKLSEVEIAMMMECLSADTKDEIDIIARNTMENKMEYSLQSCIDNYHAPESMDSVLCSQCNLNYEHSCTYGITIAPKIMMIQLKRFKYDGSKICSRISLQHTITMPSATGATDYRLSSIINHTGLNTLCGHYYMYNYDKELLCWYRYNDQSVVKTLEKNINLTESYLLLYELM